MPLLHVLLNGQNLPSWSSHRPCKCMPGRGIHNGLQRTFAMQDLGYLDMLSTLQKASHVSGLRISTAQLVC